MPLENILQALEAEAERQVAELEQATQIRIENIRAQAKEKAAATRQKHLAAIQAPLRAESARILNQAKLEAMQVVMRAREAIISSALEAAAQRLAVFPETEQYAGLLQQLTAEAVGRLGQHGQLCLCVRRRDLELMQQIVQQLGLSAVVEGNLEQESEEHAGFMADSPAGLGGLIAITVPDRRIRLSNTLSARLQRVATLYRAQIADILFDHGQED